MGNGCGKVSATKAAFVKPQGGAGGLAVHMEKGCFKKINKGRERNFWRIGHTHTHTHVDTGRLFPSKMNCSYRDRKLHHCIYK